jgi:hypothetical protein
MGPHTDTNVVDTTQDSSPDISTVRIWHRMKVVDSQRVQKIKGME